MNTTSDYSKKDEKEFSDGVSTTTSSNFSDVPLTGAVFSDAEAYAQPSPLLRKKPQQILTQEDDEAELVERTAAYQQADAPYWLANMLATEDSAVALRIFFLDNSGSTSEYDGHVVEEGTDGHVVTTSSTRWEEVCAAALDQARWCSLAGVRSEFILLNPPCPDSPQAGRDFAVLDPAYGQAEAQVRVLAKMLRVNGPRGATSLTSNLQKLQTRIEHTVRDGKRVMLTIITDGLPSCPNQANQQQQYGRNQWRPSDYRKPPAKSSKEQRKEQRKFLQEAQQSEQDHFIEMLRKFTSTCNSFVVIRLVTDNTATVGYYNKIDEDLELPVDVLDDIRAEAQEVYSAGNGWFAYTPMVHRIRERGTFESLFSRLDKRRLGLSEIAKFMDLFFRKPGESAFPRHPAKLLALAAEINQRSSHVYDARLDKMMPPLILKQLKKALRLTAAARMKSIPCCVMKMITSSSKLPRD